MRRDRLPRLVLLLALASACGPSGDGPAASTTAPTVDTAPSIPTTATSAATPTYLVYGWHGVTRTHGDASEQLVSEPVRWATEDGAGGIVFETVTDEPGWVWLPAGVDRPRRMEISNVAKDGWLADRRVFLLDGRPSALVSRGGAHMSRCEPQDFIHELAIMDLETGRERFLMCRNEGPDSGEFLTSFGGGLFTSVAWAATIGGTNSFLWFYDLDGERVIVEHNPFAESCAPCHLSAQLSSDGALLAYALWPTAYSQQPEPPDGDYTRAIREWYARQQGIPTEVVVMDMATGTDVFRTEVAADGRLTDFDGRIATVTVGHGSVVDWGRGARRLLIDVTTGNQFDIPPAMSEAAGFWTSILASLDTGTTGYHGAQRVAADLAAEHGVTTGVLWSDGFLTLNPGYWAVSTGRFDAQAQATAQCDVVNAACYPGYVATADTIDPGLGRSMLSLEPDGLGLVEFGDSEHEVLALFQRIVGSPPPDTWQEGPALDYVGWAGDIGLYLGFSRPEYQHYDRPRFVGWLYYGGSVEFDLRTPSGVGVGTTIADLRAIYGEAPDIPSEPDECGGFAIQLLGPDLGIWAELHEETGVIQGLDAGVQVGC